MELKLATRRILPTPRELAILEWLWCYKAGTSSDIYGAFGKTWQVGRQVVSGILQIMLEKGFIERHSVQSRGMYQPALSRSELEQVMMQQLADTLFHGSLYALWRSLIKHPQFRVALEKHSDTMALEVVHRPN
jgi:predicted transcriptional regulator